MGFLSTIADFFKEETSPPPREITLKDIDIDYVVKYLMEPWIVKDTNLIFFGTTKVEEYILEGETSNTLQLQYICSQDRWRTYETLPVAKAQFENISDIREELIKEKPPKKLNLNGVQYFLNETGPGKLNTSDLIYWEYIDKDDTVFLRFEQYDEHDFSCLFGKDVDPLHFDIVGDSSSESED